MKLREKTLLIIGATLVILTLLLDLFSRAILLNSFDHLQAEAVQQDLYRAQRAVNMRVWQLDTTLADWAPWDETHQFVQDANAEYVEDNLADETLINLRINFMIFMNRSNEVVYTKAVDLDAAAETSLPPDLFQHIGADSPLLKHTGNDSHVAGILLLNDGPVIVASQPITKNNFEGELEGTLIFGRYLDDPLIERVAEELELGLVIEPYQRTTAPDFTRARAIFTQTPAPVIPLNDQTVAGYATLTDIYGQPALILRVDTPNKIAQQGQTSFSFFIVALLVTGLAVGLVMMWLLEKYVLSRLTALDTRLSDIRTSASFNKRVHEQGADELSGLGHSVNMLLESIEESQQKLHNLNAALVNSLAELRLVQEQKDRFFTHAGHEFRTPLANLRTRLYLARKKPDHLDEHLTVLERVTDQMTALVEDVFNVARYSKRSLELDERDIRLQEMMAGIFDEQTRKAEAKAVNFSFTMVDEDALVYADAGKLKQALTHVFNYVINFTPANGSVVTHVGTFADETIIEIDSDNIDIKPESAGQIFQPFFRATEGGAMSTGLSLTLAKELIELHFGRILYEPNGQGGGSFTIKLLLMDESNRSAAASPQPVNGQAH